MAFSWFRFVSRTIFFAYMFQVATPAWSVVSLEKVEGWEGTVGSTKPVDPILSEEQENLYQELSFQWEPVGYKQPVGFSSIFRELDPVFWPALPESHEWRLSDDGNLYLFKHKQGEQHSFDFVTYATDLPSRFNFLSCWDGITHHSFAYTRKNSSLTTDHDARKIFPVATDLFTFNGQTCVRGHCIDFIDTQGLSAKDSINFSGKIKIGSISTFDPRNYIPEPPATYWGETIRNSFVQKIRQDGGCYAQYMYYGFEPMKTNGNISIPWEIYFVNKKNSENETINSYNIPWVDVTDPSNSKWNSIHFKKDGYTWENRLNSVLDGEGFFPSPFYHNPLSQLYADKIYEISAPYVKPGYLSAKDLWQITRAADHELLNVNGKISLVGLLLNNQYAPLQIQRWIKRLTDHAWLLHESGNRGFINFDYMQSILLQLRSNKQVDKNHQYSDALQQVLGNDGENRVHTRSSGKRIQLDESDEPSIQWYEMDVNKYKKGDVEKALKTHKHIYLKNLTTKRAKKIAEAINGAFKSPEFASVEKKNIVIKYTKKEDTKEKKAQTSGVYGALSVTGITLKETDPVSSLFSNGNGSSSSEKVSPICLGKSSLIGQNIPGKTEEKLTGILADFSRMTHKEQDALIEQLIILRRNEKKDPVLPDQPVKMVMQSIPKHFVSRAQEEIISSGDLKLKVIKMPPDGNCGYHGMGLTREEAKNMLLGNVQDPKVRELVASEIEDHFDSLPRIMKEKDDYKNLAREAWESAIALDNAARNAREELVESDPDARELDPEALFQYMIQQNMIQQKTGNGFISCQNQLDRALNRKNEIETRKKAYCRDEKTIRDYVINFIGIDPAEFIKMEGQREENYLNFSPYQMGGVYRSSAGDALAHLLGKNLTVISLDGKILHQYSGHVHGETIYLIQKDNHYDRGEPIPNDSLDEDSRELLEDVFKSLPSSEKKQIMDSLEKVPAGKKQLVFDIAFRSVYGHEENVLSLMDRIINKLENMVRDVPVELCKNITKLAFDIFGTDYKNLQISDISDRFFVLESCIKYQMNKADVDDKIRYFHHLIYDSLQKTGAVNDDLEPDNLADYVLRFENREEKNLEYLCATINKIYATPCYADLADRNHHQNWEYLADELGSVGAEDRELLSQFISHLPPAFDFGPAEAVSRFKEYNRLEKIKTLNDIKGAGDHLYSLAENAFEIHKDPSEQLNALFMIVSGLVNGLPHEEIIKNLTDKSG